MPWTRVDDDAPPAPVIESRGCEANRLGWEACRAPASVAVSLAHVPDVMPDCAPTMALLCTAHLSQVEAKASEFCGKRDQVCTACWAPIRRTGEVLRWVEQL